MQFSFCFDPIYDDPSRVSHNIITYDGGYHFIFFLPFLIFRFLSSALLILLFIRYLIGALYSYHSSLTTNLTRVYICLGQQRSRSTTQDNIPKETPNKLFSFSVYRDKRKKNSFFILFFIFLFYFCFLFFFL